MDLRLKYKKYIRNNVLKTLMKDNNISSFVELANLIGLSKSDRPTISNINTLRIKEPSNNVVKKIAKFFNVTPEYLISNSMKETAKVFYKQQNEKIKIINSKNILQQNSQFLLGEFDE